MTLFSIEVFSFQPDSVTSAELLFLLVAPPVFFPAALVFFPVVVVFLPAVVVFLVAVVVFFPAVLVFLAVGVFFLPVVVFLPAVVFFGRPLGFFSGCSTFSSGMTAPSWTAGFLALFLDSSAEGLPLFPEVLTSRFLFPGVFFIVVSSAVVFGSSFFLEAVFILPGEDTALRPRVEGCLTLAGMLSRCRYVFGRTGGEQAL